MILKCVNINKLVKSMSYRKRKKNNKSLDIIIYVMYTRVYVTPRVVYEDANLGVRYGKNEGYFLIWITIIPGKGAN